jgi:hypothetical protein
MATKKKPTKPKGNTFSTPWLPNDKKIQKELKKTIDNAYKIGKNPYQKQNDALNKAINSRMKTNKMRKGAK